MSEKGREEKKRHPTEESRARGSAHDDQMQHLETSGSSDETASLGIEQDALQIGSNGGMCCAKVIQCLHTLEVSNVP